MVFAEWRTTIQDVLEAAQLVSLQCNMNTYDQHANVIQVLSSSGSRLLHAWIYVPLGILCILSVCFGVNALISLTPVKFSASVACMIITFSLLIVCEQLLGSRKTKDVVRLLEIPVSVIFSRYLAVSHTPISVILL